MKKRILSFCLVFLLCGAVTGMMTGCGEKEPYAEYDLTEYVTVGEYKGLEYEEPKVSVTQDEINAEIQRRREVAAETVTVEAGIVEDGDVINVAFVGKIDGKTFEGGSSDSYDITVGTTPMIDGFVEGLIGKEVGETVTLDLQFPEDYGKEDLNGKDVVFTVTINSKQAQNIPAYDLDFVKNTSGFDSFEDYEASLEADLLETKKADAESEAKSGVWEKIVDSSEVIQYPAEKDELVQATMDSFKKSAEDAGVEWDAYLEQIGYTEEELNDQCVAYAETKIFQEMIVYSIAKEEGLSVSDSEYETYMSDLLTQSGLDEASFESSYGMTIEEYCEQEGLRAAMLLNKVMEKVMEYSKAV